MHVQCGWLHERAARAGVMTGYTAAVAAPTHLAPARVIGPPTAGEQRLTGHGVAQTARQWVRVVPTVFDTRRLQFGVGRFVHKVVAAVCCVGMCVIVHVSQK